MSSSSGKGAHVLVFPYPAQGHMLPILDLTHQLALHGLTITILVTPKNLPILNPLLSTHPSSSIQTLVFPFPHHPSLPSTVENVKDIGNSGNLLIINALSKLSGPILQWFNTHPSPPVALLSDFFLGWTHHLAHQIGIPRICFYSSGAFLTSILACSWVWDDIDTLLSLDVVDFPDLPHSPSFPKEHLPSVFLAYRKSNPMWEFVKDGIIANSASWGCVFNTFYAIEGEYLEYSKKKMGHERVFAVGPLSLLGGPDHTSRGSTSSSGVSSDNILAWLDVCPDGSVLYVCFGSQKLLKRAQMEALSSALEQSGIKFIWVVKSPTAQQVADGYGFVSHEFEKRVSGKGLIIKEWAPQVSILNHRAVGGFLSHYGWNSVLEAIVSGVTILGWPMEADQFVNAKLLEDYMGVAVRVCEGPDIVPDSFELAQKVAESMNAEITEKVRAKELKVKALEGVKHCGSSSRDLDGLVKELAQLQLKNV